MAVKNRTRSRGMRKLHFPSWKSKISNTKLDGVKKNNRFFLFDVYHYALGIGWARVSRSFSKSIHGLTYNGIWSFVFKGVNLPGGRSTNDNGDGQQ